MWKPPKIRGVYCGIPRNECAVQPQMQADGPQRDGHTLHKDTMKAAPRDRQSRAAKTSPFELDALFGRLDRRLDAITEEMVEHYRQEIPAYASLPREVLDNDVRPVSRRNLEIFFAAVKRGGGPLAGELESVGASAAERALQGVPLTDLLHAYRAGTRIAWTAVLDEIARGPASQQALIGRLASHVLSYLDSVSTAVEEAYLKEWHGLVYRRAHGRWELANELLRDPDPARVHVLAESAGIALPDVIQVAALPTGKPAPTDSDEGLAGFLVDLQGRSVFFLDPAGTRASQALLLQRTGGPLGVAEGRSWVEGMGPAVAAACRIADLAAGMKLVGAVHSEDLMVEQILSADPLAARRLYNSRLKKLAEIDTSGDLFRTLEEYLESGCRLVDVARKLHIHPNTVAYRLARIGEVGGLDLDSANDRFEAQLAIRARRFYLLGDQV